MKMLRGAGVCGLVVVLAWAGCGGGSDGGGDAGPGIDASTIDAATADAGAVDGSVLADAPPADAPSDDAATADAGAVDGSVLADAPPADAPSDDAAMPADAATPSDATPPQDAPPSGCSSPPLPTDPVECYQACDSTSECEWVDSSCCCDCFNGGAQTAINSAYSAQWAARQTATCAVVDCSGVGCLTVVVCRDEPPTCVSGRCM